MYPSQVTALSSPRVTSILTHELVLLVFELKWNNTECTLLCWASFIMFVSFKHIFECGCSSFLFLISHYQKYNPSYLSFLLLTHIWAVSSLENYQIMLL